MIEQTQAKRNKLINIVIFAIFFALAYLGVQQFSGGSDAPEDVLPPLAEELNSKTPFMVDEFIRADSASTKGNSFTYYYTITNAQKNDIDEAMVVNTVKPLMIEEIRTNEDMALYKKLKTTIVYSYYDANGELFTNITISPDDYLE